jgi:hypothetical protein
MVGGRNDSTSRIDPCDESGGSESSPSSDRCLFKKCASSFRAMINALISLGRASTRKIESSWE